MTCSIAARYYVGNEECYNTNGVILKSMYVICCHVCLIYCAMCVLHYLRCMSLCCMSHQWVLLIYTTLHFKAKGHSVSDQHSSHYLLHTQTSHFLCAVLVVAQLITVHCTTVTSETSFIAVICALRNVIVLNVN
jgi:L-asparagine transporter-like permease